jgi:hypothetical protein
MSDRLSTFETECDSTAFGERAAKLTAYDVNDLFSCFLRNIPFSRQVEYAEISCLARRQCFLCGHHVPAKPFYQVASHSLRYPAPRFLLSTDDGKSPGLETTDSAAHGCEENSLCADLKSKKAGRFEFARGQDGTRK